MLKKISVQDLRMGMHLHGLEGEWLKHPFWKTKFVIDSTDDLRLLKTCGVAECWIDDELGLGVLQPETSPPPQAPPAAPAAPALVSADPARSREPQPMAAELKQAAAICRRGRQAVTAMFNEARMGRTVQAADCLPLVEEISNSVNRNPGALVSLARLKTRDDYSYMHSLAVCALMVAMARATGMEEDQCREAGLAGLMHDIGKALMPLEILNKPGKLTDEEFAVIRTHPAKGFELIRGGQGTLTSTLDVVLHHHERVDGTGYPRRLAAEQLSPLARMGAICDVYDAITSNRPYKQGWDPAESIARMASWKGHFDTTLFAVFVQSLGIYPIGSAVRLASGKIAVVAEQNPGNLTSPVVVAFFSTKTELHITPLRIDLSRSAHERIVGREEGAGARFPHMNELWADPETLRRAKP
jgi:HD-GYP domain-containing protein (c-di-GMP phosphodiesterase class II)